MVDINCQADGRVVDELALPKCKFNENGVCTAEDIEIEVCITTNPIYFNCITFKKGFNLTAKWNIYAKDEEDEKRVSELETKEL